MLRSKSIYMFFKTPRYILFGLLFFVSACTAQPLSESSSIEGCRVFNFDDGHILTLKEKNVARLGATMSARTRLFEVIMKVPDEISNYISEIAIFPFVESSNKCSVDKSESNFCFLTIKGKSISARIRILSGTIDKSKIATIKRYLEDSICEE